MVCSFEVNNRASHSHKAPTVSILQAILAGVAQLLVPIHSCWAPGSGAAKSGLAASSVQGSLRSGDPTEQL